MALNTPRVAKIDFARPAAIVKERTPDAKASIKPDKQSFDNAMSKSEEKFATAKQTNGSSESNEKKQVTSDESKLESANSKEKPKEENSAEDIANEIENQNLAQQENTESSDSKDVVVDAVVFVPEQKISSEDIEVAELDEMTELTEAVVTSDMVMAVAEIESMIQEAASVIKADSSDSAEKLMAEVNVLTIETVVQANSSDGELRLTKEDAKLITDATELLKNYVKDEKGETSSEFEKLNNMVKELNGTVVSTKTTKVAVPEEMSKEMPKETQELLDKTNNQPKKTLNTSIKNAPEIRIDEPMLEAREIEVSNQKIETIRTAGKTVVFEQVKEAIIKEPISAGEQSEMIIKLKPEELGKVELKIEVHNDIVIAKFDVASQMVKEVIESNLEDLKNALKDKGFEDLTFDVNVNKDNQQKQQGQTGKRRRRINLETSVEDGNESYVKSLSAMINENAFEHLA